MGTIKRNKKSGSILYLDDEGKWHREDGPAYYHKDIYEEWCINGQTHREDGPARIWGPKSYTSNRNPEYWLNDIKYSKDEWDYELLKKKLGRIKDI